jgi:hypothetical protein
MSVQVAPVVSKETAVAWPSEIGVNTGWHVAVLMRFDGSTYVSTLQPRPTGASMSG